MPLSQGAGGWIGGCGTELVQSPSTTWALTLSYDRLSDHALSRLLGCLIEWSGHVKKREAHAHLKFKHRLGTLVLWCHVQWQTSPSGK